MFTELKAGDHFMRRMGHDGPTMKMEVLRIDDVLIHARAVGGPGGYTFDRETGVEEDHELGWGVQFKRTGTFIDRIATDALTKERNPG